MPTTQEGSHATATFQGPYYDGNVTINNPGVPLNVSQGNLVQILNPVHDAAYNRGPRASSVCFQGTRVDILKKLTKWGDRPSKRRIAWLNGPAGHGKSAILRTLAEHWDRNKKLVGSFCFFRNSGNLSKATHLIPTLVFQLTLSVPETKPIIEKALRDDPHLLHANPGEQLQKLFAAPINAVRRKSRIFRPWLQNPMFIVVDGLDECDDFSLIAKLIDAITSAEPQLPVLFFFTSRMEEDIQSIFRSKATSAVTYELSLMDFSAHEDVRHFLREAFDSIHNQRRRLMLDIPRPWPSPPELYQLVEMVNGSFIFAATLAEYVKGGDRSDPPPTRFAPIVKNHKGVDNMYKQILAQPWTNPRFQTVFSAIILLKERFSITGLEFLLQLPSHKIRSDILDIQSIVVLPEDKSAKVEILHTSLRDFSMSPERSEEFCVGTAERHLELAIQCLRAISMKPSGSEDKFEEETTEYASHYWQEHLRAHLALQKQHSESMRYELLMEIFKGFVSQGFDTWSNTVLWKWGTKLHEEALQEIAEEAQKIPMFPSQIVIILDAIKENLKSVRAFHRPRD